MSIKITFGVGYFALNGAKYPKGHYLVQGDSDTLNIYSTDGNLVVSSKRENFVDSLDAPFATMNDLLAEFDSAFSLGGSDGFGVTRESNTVIFDGNYVIGNAAPRTGNLLFDFTNARLLSETMMIHQDGAAFTFPAEAVILTGSASTTVPNYIYMKIVNTAIGSQKVHVRIYQ